MPTDTCPFGVFVGGLKELGRRWRRNARHVRARLRGLGDLSWGHGREG